MNAKYDLLAILKTRNEAAQGRYWRERHGFGSRIDTTPLQVAASPTSNWSPDEPCKVESELWKAPTVVWRLAPALETRERFGDSSRIDGELYWSPGRRGNIPARKVGTIEKRFFHPFTGKPDPLPSLLSASSVPVASGPFGEEPSC